MVCSSSLYIYKEKANFKKANECLVFNPRENPGIPSKPKKCMTINLMKNQQKSHLNCVYVVFLEGRLWQTLKLHA